MVGKPSNSRSACTAAVTLLERLNLPCLTGEEIKGTGECTHAKMTNNGTDSGAIFCDTEIKHQTLMFCNDVKIPKPLSYPFFSSSTWIPTEWYSREPLLSDSESVAAST